MSEWHPFPKIPRLRREIVITEKLDGTNASVLVPEDDGLVLQAYSRTRYLAPGKQTDNYGFAEWVADNHAELRLLGPGIHFGEWWGKGINRGYGLNERRFSLFNVGRWNTENVPSCCHVVPQYAIRGGIMGDATVAWALDSLRFKGSWASPGFMNPEGVIVYHTAGKHYYKVTLENDEQWKGNNAPA
jgi:hypothetical protein